MQNSDLFWSLNFAFQCRHKSRETEHEKYVLLHVFSDFLIMKFCET